MKELRLILFAMRRHKIIVMLLTLLVALAFAIVSNCAFMIAIRMHQMSLPTGIVENQISAISSVDARPSKNPWSQHEADLAALRAIPGVHEASATDGPLPLNEDDYSDAMCPTEQALQQAIHSQSLATYCFSSTIYRGTSSLVHTLGLQLVGGRNFRSDEIVNSQTTPYVAIVSRALANAMYPGQKAVGKTFYADPSHGTQIVGIVDPMLRPHLYGSGQDYYSVIFPQTPDGPSATYVLRSDPQERERILRAARAVLLKLNANRIITYQETFTQIRLKYFKRDMAMIELLIASALCLLLVTALGIGGLAGFWVQQRKRSIGVRRAIGATRRDILQYFQIENLLIVSLGLVLGAGFTIGLNVLLMTHYEFPRIPMSYLATSAITLWALGQVAVLAPALRASNVPPALAAKSS